MGNQSQSQGTGSAVDPVGTGLKNSHAAGSGSTTGDPGKPRGPQPAQQAPATPSRQAVPGASPDDHIESRQDSQNH